MLGRDLDEAQEWVRSWTEQLSARAHAAAEMSDRVSAVTATASTGDRAVTVTVAATGNVVGLELDERVCRMPAHELARVIMVTIARAQAKLADHVVSAVRDTVGVDSETGRAVIDSYARRFPPPPEDTTGGDEQSGHPRGR